LKEVLRQLYSLVPLKKQLFMAMRLFWVPSERVYKHLYFRGPFRVRIDRNHSFYLRHYGYQIENEVFWAGLEGAWEKKSLALWIDLCRGAKVIFDIGANTGLYGLVARSVNPDARVYALEPVKRVCEKLRENNVLNDYDIVCIEKAASNSNGPAIIYDTKTDHVLSVTVGKNLNPDAEVVPTTIETIRLETLIRDLQISRVDLIKVDVETHEPEVLEGFGAHLDEYRPAMLIEILSDEVGGKVEALVADKGYLYFNIDDRSGLVTQQQHIRKSDYYNYLLCNNATARKLKLI
jgi:FkbM family methyltransferase